MAFSNPTFEQRRAQVLGKTPQQQQQAVQPVVSSGGYSNPSFEQRRVQIAQQPSQQQKPKQQTSDPKIGTVQPSVYKKVQNDALNKIVSAKDNVVKQVKRIDFDRIKNAIVKEAKVYKSEEGRVRRKEALVSGVKLVPSQIKIGASVIADSIAKQQGSYEDYFNFLPKPFKASSQPKDLLGKLVAPKIQKATPKIREKATQEQKKAIEPYAKLGEAQTPGQKIAESLMLNLPQIATSTGLTVATALVTKNPALAKVVGMSTSYGLGSSEVYTNARQNGLSDKDALPLSMIGGAIIGALDFAPLNRLIGKTGTSKKIQQGIVSKIASGIVSAGTQSGFEGITEGLQEIVGNAVQRTYDENAKLFENVSLSAVVGAIFGGFSDVGISAITSVKGKSIEDASSEVSAKIEEAISTEPENRSEEQQQIVDSVLTAEVSPDQALQIVLDQKLDKTDEGKQIVKTVLQAKQEDKDIKIVTSEDNEIQSVEVVDKEYKPISQNVKKEPTDEILVEANKFKSANEFYLRMNDSIRTLLREKGIRGEEAIVDFWNKNAVKTEPILDSLNPTGSLYANYDPQSRMNMKLGENITTYDKTSGLKPDELVTIYRGASKKHTKINPGDFVTTKREVAESYTGDKNVIQMEVKARDILDDINEPLGDEYIYRPEQKEKSKKVSKPQKRTIFVGKEKTEKVFNSKEARVIQEAVSNKLDRIAQTAKSAEEVIKRMTPEIETAIKNAKGERYALSGIRTAIKKQMYALAGISEGENYKSAYAQLKLAQKEDPEIGQFLSYIEQTMAEIDNDLISAKPRKAYKGGKLSKGIKEGENVTQKPIGEGKKKKSRLAVGVEQKAIEKGLIENLSDLPEFKSVNMKDQARLASELLATDRAKAVRVALGQENPPSNLLPESVFTAVENEALADGDVSLIRQLATSSRTTEATAMGQRIRALAERNPHSPVNIMRQLVDLRMQSFEKRNKTTFDRSIKEQTKVLKTKLSLEERKIKSAQSIIDTLTC